MPTYEYRCEKCGEQFEVFQSFSDRALRRHPDCGGPVEKVLHPRGIVFKGSGFLCDRFPGQELEFLRFGRIERFFLRQGYGRDSKSGDKSGSGDKAPIERQVQSGDRVQVRRVEVGRRVPSRGTGPRSSEKSSGDRPSTSSANRD